MKVRAAGDEYRVVLQGPVELEAAAVAFGAVSRRRGRSRRERQIAGELSKTATALELDALRSDLPQSLELSGDEAGMVVAGARTVLSGVSTWRLRTLMPVAVLDSTRAIAATEL